MNSRRTPISAGRSAAAEPAPITLATSSTPRAACGLRLACSLSGTCVDIAFPLRASPAQEKSPIDRHGRFGVPAQCEVGGSGGPFASGKPDIQTNLRHFTPISPAKSSKPGEGRNQGAPNIVQFVLRYALVCGKGRNLKTSSAFGIGHN